MAPSSARAALCLCIALGGCTPIGRGPAGARAAVTVPTADATATAVGLPALGPSGPAALSALPKGAALYGSLRWDQLESVRVARVNRDHPDSNELEQLLDDYTKGIFEVLARIHADRERPILFALMAPSEPNARTVIDALVASGQGRATESAVHAARGEAILLRLLVPLAPGAAPPDSNFPLTTGGVLEPQSCESTGRCSAFSRQRPLWLSKAALGVRLALYRDGRELRLDAAMPLFAEPDDPEPWQTLAELAARRGGPEAPRCVAFDEQAAAAVCIDADRMAELGTAFEYSKILRALQTPGIEPRMVQRIAEEGRAEARQNIALASPVRRLLDDGTLRVDAREGRLAAAGSWSIAPSARAGLQQALASEICTSPAQMFASLLPAFGDAGPDFSDPKRTLQAAQEAGWTFWPVAFARSWPNVLIVERGRFSELEWPAATSCARLHGDRLEIETRP